MIEPRILTLYKTLKLKLEVTRIKLEELEAKKQYLSIKVDVNKKNGIENDIRVTEDYMDKLIDLLKQTIQVLTNKKMNACDNDVERLIFQHYIVEGLSAKETLSIIGRKDVTTGHLYNTASKINKQLAEIKVDKKLLEL